VTRGRFLRHLGTDERGATAIEFALLAPAFITMLFGVLQVGIGLQSYNALRNVSADVARYAMVQYARGNELSAAELQTYVDEAGSGAPYLLAPSELDVVIAPAGVQRVANATELTMTLTYQIPSILAGMGLEGPEIDYVRPIFLTD
jgi:Flp pilus assembly protein TadG